MAELEFPVALTLQYTFNGVTKTVGYANDKHQSMFEAAAKAEGFDIRQYQDLEHQVQMSTRDKKSHRDFRDNYFKKLGFSEVKVIRDAD
ncbi:DUF2960 family protein [uncultured Ferrimonas sp.]|uniref:DUF2960 family protein n=1 Tax=uncultured Ferrimonas sp. TaxID=432640 RepID=UPI00260822B2|nr:DUF2960 family protein [uncultured Ferrimonas sp.]